jgi:hypothetical protein
MRHGVGGIGACTYDARLGSVCARVNSYDISAIVCAVTAPIPQQNNCVRLRYLGPDRGERSWL